MKKIIIFVIFLFLRCAPDAPHNNPLDPNNPDAKGKIKGEVKTLPLVGSNPLQNAIVEIFPTLKKDTTDEEGKFSIPNLEPGDYIVSVKKEMYVDKAETISVEKGVEREIQFKLNGKPVIRTYSICSMHSKNTKETYEVIFTLSFFDPDAYFFVDSVFALSKSEGFSLYFKSGDTVGVFEKKITYNTSGEIDTLVGIPFHFWVKDHEGAYSNTLTTSLARVIHELPDIIFPDSGDTISTGDTLKWNPPELSPEIFSTILKMWQNPENPVWESDTLQVTESMFVFIDSLEPGIYDWAVEVQDKYGNCSRTIERLYFIENLKR